MKHKSPSGKVLAIPQTRSYSITTLIAIDFRFSSDLIKSDLSLGASLSLTQRIFSV